MRLKDAPGEAHLSVSSTRVGRMTLSRWAFVLMCFAPQVRNLIPQMGLTMLLAGTALAYVTLPWNRLPRSALFFCAYFVSFGLFGLIVQLFGESPPGTPPTRPLFFYALFALALVLEGLEILQQPDGRRFVLNALCVLLIAEIMVVGLQFSHMSFGVGLELGEDAVRDRLIEGSYGNPNNVAVVLSLLLMVLVLSGHVHLSSLTGTALVVGTLVSVFVTLSRTAVAFLCVFLAAAMFLPNIRRVSLASSMRALRRALPVLAALLVFVIMLIRSGVITNFEDLAVIERSVERISELSTFAQDASVEWRMTVAARLVESLPSLGFGSMSDQNYGQYFQPLDPALASINPHSYLVEMSFLFGYPGLCLALSFLVVAVWRIVAATGARPLLGLMFGSSVLFFQMVPSSLLSLDIFFLIAAIAGTRSLYGAVEPVRRPAPLPSVATPQVPLQ